jgi:hypothetical protein
MNRREFLATGVAATAAANLTGSSVSAGSAAPRQFFEWRQYHLRTGTNKNMVGEFLKSVGIVALNRIGIKPVGVFTPVYGPSNAKLYVLLVHDSLDAVVNASARLLEDKEVREKGASFIDASISEPAYVRFESSLMVAFSHLPKLEVPALKERIFELRIYESHCAKMGKKKVEMFNEGGEIAIFKKTGLTPVFFGESIIGPNLPNLNYMLAFKDMADRDQRWQVFRDDPDWKKLSANPAYRDTVSNITDIILRPTEYSQI